MAFSPALFSAHGIRARSGGGTVAVRAPGGGVPSLRGPQLALESVSMPVPAGVAAAPLPVSASAQTPPLAPELLHPALWRAHQIGRPRETTLASGFAALDAQLPGGGWPHRVLTELLLPHPGVGEMRLLAPALAAVAGLQRSVMLFDPPAALCGWALAQLGVDAQQLIVVHGRDGATGARMRHLLASADLLWSLEQALKSGHVGAVLAWLPDRLRADALRRLQLAAQVHDGPVFLLRGIEMRLRPSAAPLRLALHGVGVDELSVQILKRRGPALAQPLRLGLPPVLPAALRARVLAQVAQSALSAQAARAAGAAGAAGTGAAPMSATQPLLVS